MAEDAKKTDVTVEKAFKLEDLFAENGVEEVSESMTFKAVL